MASPSLRLGNKTVPESSACPVLPIKTVLDGIKELNWHKIHFANSLLRRMLPQHNTKSHDI